MNGLLVRVGIDSADGRWNAPMRLASGEFAYVTITEAKPLRPGMARRYDKFHGAIKSFGERLPEDLRGQPTHLDPDFDHLTYGDQGQRGRRVASLEHGDLRTGTCCALGFCFPLGASPLAERQVQVGDQIIVVFDANGQPQQCLRDAQPLPVSRLHLRVRCSHRRTDGGFHSTQTGSRPNQLQPALHRIGRPSLGLHVECQHRAKAAHLCLGDGVAGISRQAGIINARHPWMPGKKLCEPARIGGLTLNPQVQCLQATFQQIAGGGVEAAAQMAGLVPDLGCQCLTCDRIEFQDAGMGS